MQKIDAVINKQVQAVVDKYDVSVKVVSKVDGVFFLSVSCYLSLYYYKPPFSEVYIDHFTLLSL